MLRRTPLKRGKPLPRGTAKLKQRRSTGKPTKAQSRRMDAIQSVGCICCMAFGHHGVPCQVHHLTADGKHGSKRRGHAYTIGICPWHHVGEPVEGKTIDETKALLGPSFKLHAREFREFFGNDDALLALQNTFLPHD